MTIKMFVTGAILSLLLGTGVQAEEQKEPDTGGELVERSGFGMCLATDRIDYAAGEPIAMSLDIFNRTGKAAIFQFRNAQRYDFAIENEDGDVVWHWSEGQMFAQMMEEEKLGVDREAITYTAKYEGRLEPGIYTLLGMMTSTNRPMSAKLVFQVKPTETRGRE